MWHVSKFRSCTVTALFVCSFFLDSFIQKTKQRYNNTRTLTSRLNLSEMSEDLHNNPPFEISLTELGTDNNKDIKTYKTGGIQDMWIKCTATDNNYNNNNNNNNNNNSFK